MAFRSHYQLKHYDNDICFPVKEEVIREMIPYLHDKASDGRYTHQKGRISKDLENSVKDKLSKITSFKTEEVYFTSGVTESNNLAMNVLLPESNKTIAYLATERSSIVRYISQKNIPSIKIPVTKTGYIILDQLEQILINNTQVGIVTVSTANHETGTLQPVKEIASLCKKYGVLFHSDISTAFGKTSIDYSLFDLMTISSRNIGGPSGIAVLLCKDTVSIQPIIIGDSKEGQLRGGNHPTFLIAGLGKAISLICEDRNINRELLQHTDNIVAVLKNYGITTINSDKSRLPSYLNFCVPCDADKLVERMESEYAIAVSKGYLGSESRVLKEQGVDADGRKNCIRVSFPVIHDSERGNFPHDLVRCIKEVQRMS